MSQKKNKTLLIIGCGYLGEFVVEYAQSVYQNTIAVVRTSKRLKTLESSQSDIQVIDVFNEAIDYESLVGGEEFDVIFMIPPSAIGPEATSVNAAMKKVVQELQQASCSNALLISSTGIYGNLEKETVTAESPPAPKGARGERLAVIEDCWLSAGAGFKVLRLAGIYGPGRIIGQRALARGEAVGGKSEAWLNLIHAVDAASLSIECLNGAAEKIELGSDNNPVRRKDYYNQVASLLRYSAPQFKEEPALQKTSYPTRISHGKKCDPSSTYHRLMWSPRFEDYIVGLRASLNVNSGNGE